MSEPDFDQVIAAERAEAEKLARSQTPDERRRARDRFARRATQAVFTDARRRRS